MKVEMIDSDGREGLAKEDRSLMRKCGNKRVAHILLFFILLSVLLSFAIGASAADRNESPFSPTILMQPRHGSGLVCIMVAVPAGSAREIPQRRGISHFLEHMVFDGSEEYSRVEISDWMDNSGAFLNAFTREETTIYFTLVPSYEFEKALDILSQMLLHSTFPESEIEKERRVITEEIRKDEDNISSVRDAMVRRCLYAGSPLSEEVIGTPETVGLITRAELIEYYRRFYEPCLMTIYILGDFSPSEAEKMLSSYFPTSTAGSDGCGAGTGYEAIVRRVAPPVYTNRITYVRRADLKEGLELLVSIPSSDLDYRDIAEAMVMVEALNGFSDPLSRIKEKMGLSEARAELDLKSSFMAVRFHFNGIGCNDEKMDGILEELRKLSEWKPRESELRAVKTSLLSERMFDKEKFHYYVMLEGERVATLGREYLEALDKGIEEVRSKDIGEIAKETFGSFEYNGCYIYGCNRRERVVSRAAWEAVHLDNGCIVAAGERQGSNVFAVTILFRSPVSLEKEFFPGAAKLLHLLYEHSRSGEIFKERLASMGAKVEWQDNPYIPFDDYLVNPSASFIKLLAPADKGKEALQSLVHFLLESRLDDGDLESVKKRVFMESGIRSRSPGFMRKNLILSVLFQGQPYSYSLYPSAGSLAGVNLSAIEEFRKRYFSGSNMVVSIVSPIPRTEALDLLKSKFRSFPKGEELFCPAVPDSSVFGKEIRKHLPFKSLYLERLWPVKIYEAAGFSAGSSEEKVGETAVDAQRVEAALVISSEVLSRRMQERIREEEGIAYSTGCSVIPLPGIFVLRAYLGTAPASFSLADSLMKSCITSLSSDPPDEEEIELARKRAMGKMLRRELSSDNRAYFIGFELAIAGNGEVHRLYSDLLQDVSCEEVQKVTAECFELSGMVSMDIFPERGQHGGM